MSDQYSQGQSPLNQQQGQKRLSLGLILALVIIVVIVIGGYLLYTNVLHKPSTNGNANVNGQSAQHLLTSEEKTQYGIDANAKAEVTTINVNGQEIQAFTVDPATLPPDADGDRLLDSEEAQYKADPKNPDTDGDGILDGDEVHIWKTDPAKKDTDGDGFDDGTEISTGFNPLGSGKLQ